MWVFMRPTSQAFLRMSCGQAPSLSSSQATGRISFSAKECASSRKSFCSSVSVKSTATLCSFGPRLISQSTNEKRLQEQAGQDPNSSSDRQKADQKQPELLGVDGRTARSHRLPAKALPHAGKLPAWTRSASPSSQS